MLQTRIFHKSEQETWFNVTEHPLPKGTLWAKYEPD